MAEHSPAILSERPAPLPDTVPTSTPPERILEPGGRPTEVPAQLPELASRLAAIGPSGVKRGSQPAFGLRRPPAR
jgi:hypothetical protein